MEEGGGPGIPRAPGATGDLSGHGRARGLRRGPWSHTADRVNDRRHFSLWTRKGEECQWSRDRRRFRSLRRTRFLPATLSSTKIISGSLSLPAEPTRSGADGLLQKEDGRKERSREEKIKEMARILLNNVRETLTLFQEEQNESTQIPIT